MARIALLNSLSRLIYERGWHDQAFIETRTQNFDEFKAKNLTQDLDHTLQLTGLLREQISMAAEWIAKPKSDTLLLYEKGLIWGLKNYENVASVVDLALLTGNLGKPGADAVVLAGIRKAIAGRVYPGNRPPNQRG